MEDPPNDPMWDLDFNKHVCKRDNNLERLQLKSQYNI